MASNPEPVAAEKDAKVAAVGETPTIAVASQGNRKREHSAAHSGNDEVVDLIVGGHPYRTSRDLLLSSPFLEGDEDTYFHAIFSGRWENTHGDGRPIEVTKIEEGHLFFYVLYYLQLGEIPRGVDSASHHSLLSKEDIDTLEQQAQFFGLRGLVKLCQDTKGVLKGLKGGSTGDLDLSPYSDFSVEITRNATKYEYEFSFHMKYRFQGSTAVEAAGEVTDNGGDCYNSLHVSAGEYPNKKVIFADNETFPSHFERLKTLVESESAKIGDKGRVSVANVLKQTDIAPAAHLWFAFVVDDMIDYFDQYENWEGEYCDAVGFLFSDTSSCFVCDMKTVK